MSRTVPASTIGEYAAAIGTSAAWSAACDSGFGRAGGRAVAVAAAPENLRASNSSMDPSLLPRAIGVAKKFQERLRAGEKIAGFLNYCAAPDPPGRRRARHPS